MTTLVSADVTSRARRRQHAYVRGNSIDAFTQPDLARECDQVRDLLRLARVSIVGWDLTDLDQREAVISLIARNAALNQIGVTEQAVSTTFGHRPDPALLRSFRDLRDHATSTLRHAARVIGTSNFHGLIAEHGTTGVR